MKADAGKKPATAKQGSAVQWIEAALMDDIAAEVLARGERLDEVRLTVRFAVSRTSVREALSRLVAQGVLVTGQERGVRVAEYSREQLAQTFEAMDEIEATCARMASQRLTLLSRAEIEAAQAACVAAAAAGDIPAYLHANAQFHRAIYRATGNPCIAEIALDFRDRTGPFRAKRFAATDDLLDSAQAHDELLADIFPEDSATASQGMRKHMRASFIQTLTRSDTE